ncbi:MAG: glycosyltransferase [Bacteroidetes bacterium]|nr:glycosyltransferase [Bacteroidota bacterium]MBU1679842.1 glycosyltransferase [Bacteroidota bacterium]MBU2507942.1 glycosyltransferase [Bacteroidota bacterium]
MKYSVIIPTLNEEKLLPVLLNQLNQEELRKEFEFEIIISDGSSNDNTVEIALANADKVIVHTEKYKQNIAEGRNLGAEKAEGEILIFLNGDVKISSPFQLFSKIRSEFENGKYIGMTCDVIVDPVQSKFEDKLFLGFYNYYFHWLNLIGMGMGRGECQVVSKKVFFEEKGYNKNLAAGEDFDLFKRLRTRGKILFCHDIDIHESPRRYRRYGHWHIFFTWLLNSISVVLRKKSFNKEWEQVR